MSPSSARRNRERWREPEPVDEAPQAVKARSKGAWARCLVPPLLIAFLGVAAYSNSLVGEFVFDDPPRIAEDEFIRDPMNYLPGSAGYRAMPNRAIGNLTFALNYQVNGLNVTGYHVVNTLVHLLNALLVYVLIVLSFRTPWLRGSSLAARARSIGLVAGLLFVAHPIQTQAVTYIVQRYTSLATMFYLLAMVLYLRWRLGREAGGHRGARGVVAYLPILVVAVLAMKTKEIAFTLPIVATLFEAALFASPWRDRVRSLLPLLATLLVIPATLLSLGRPAGETISDVAEVTRVATTMTRWDYAVTQFPVIATYLRLLVLPVGQNLDYDYPIYRSLLEPRVFLSILLVLALLAAAAYLHAGRSGGRERGDPARRLVALGILWFFVTLSVESSLIPIADVIFEHRAYLPAAGFFIAVATAMGLAARRLAPARWPTFTVMAGTALALPLAVATHLRNEVWASELSVWTDVLAKSPEKARPWNNLGFALARMGRDAEALRYFQQAVRLDPGHVRGRNNLAVALGKIGRTVEAEALLRETVRLAPDYAEAQYNLGRLRLGQESGLEEAARLFRAAISIRPSYADAYGNLAAALNSMGRYPETVGELERASRTIQDNAPARFNLGVAYFELGNAEGVKRELAALTGLSPDLARRLREFIQEESARRVR